MSQTQSDSSFNAKTRKLRLTIRTTLSIIIITLPFFQPGLWEISAIAAFIVGFKRSSVSRTFWGLTAAACYMAIYTLTAIFVLPFIHIYTTAAWLWVPVWGPCLAAAIASATLAVQARARRWRRARQFSLHGLSWLAAISIAFISWMSSTNQEMVEWSMAQAVAPANIPRLPNSDLPNFRLLPRSRAADYFSTSNDDKTLSVSMPHMAPCDSSGKPCWQSAFHLKDAKNGIWYNLFFDTVFHVATVDPTDINKNSSKTDGLDGFFLAGPESWVVKAAFAVHNPFSQQQEAMYWRNSDGTMTMLIPYISYRPSVSGIMVPYLAGVMSVNRFGLINDMSPLTAKAKYPGMPFYPTQLARLYAERIAQWNGGIWGRTVSKRDELKVSEPEADDDAHFNKAPYVEVFEELGWQEVIALVPNAEDSKALASILFFDAATGECRQYVLPQNQNLSGPAQASGNSKQGNWQADWSGHMKVEPRPLIRSGRIYYAVGILDTVRNEHPYLGSIIIDAADMKPYPVLNHKDLLNLIEKLEKGINVEPVKLPSVTIPE